MPRTLSQVLQDYLTEWRISQNRLVTKDGLCNINYSNMRYRNCFSYMLDIWTTFLEIHWTFLMFFFVASFLFSWFVFGLLWYWVGWNNGDLLWQNPTSNKSACVINVYDLTTAFLFSLETQTFIAYGWRVITTICPSAVTVYVFQVLLGAIITSFWGGVVLGKISLPKKRAQTIIFNTMAVICPRQNALCLKIRVANLRKSLLIRTNIYGKLIKTSITPDGEIIIMDQVNIDFSAETGKDNPLFICPLTLYHVIDKTSPFFEMAMDTMHQQDFELVVFLDGTVESTSFSCQVRTSYLPNEIIWGKDFLPIITFTSEGRYHADFSNFTKLTPVSTAHCPYCFQDEKWHHYESKQGIDNEAFELAE